MSKTELKIDTSSVPDHVRDKMSRVLLRGVREYFSVPEHMEDYERWHAEYLQRKRERGGEQ